MWVLDLGTLGGPGWDSPMASRTTCLGLGSHGICFPCKFGPGVGMGWRAGWPGLCPAGPTNQLCVCVCVWSKVGSQVALDSKQVLQQTRESSGPSMRLYQRHSCHPYAVTCLPRSSKRGCKAHVLKAEPKMSQLCFKATTGLNSVMSNQL